MKQTAEGLQRRALKKHTPLRKQRLSYGLQVKDVAQAIGVDQSYMTLLEQAKRVPSLAIALRLADFYKTTVEVLFPALQQGVD